MGERAHCIPGRLHKTWEGRMKTKEEVREQIQEDIRTYLNEYEIPQPCMYDLCQIVVDNFKELE